MGITNIEAALRGPAGERTVKLLVDSGAGYTLVPDGVWQELGLTPIRDESFALADGTRIERRMSHCLIVLNGVEGPTHVILGEPGDHPLLGVITLEEFGLVLNPFTRSLHPMRLLLAKVP